ncbi:3-oxo-5-alpha-steroid 4-dehydrogenase, putative [Bodo saltans]|uniref:3-oxo-5-alpha-steroid 4-dehydrogenase, putative n=1 Tax=Bodo saltans TaxID=75058 RepID=A0A0S4JTN4_BODSA|nr:3-oxo-5-alpha-steroid 4-dehydrogenase, putative [Bodo saltans]|eukprot:CUG91916.1 3-oxo-5-alpha-steroid 4-dehydrogenase, putative [Bodo saltans]
MWNSSVASATMVDISQWLDATLTTFFVAAIGVVILRCYSKSFASMTTYGGRHVNHTRPPGDSLEGKTHRQPTTVGSILRCPVSRRTSFQCFYCAGALSLGIPMALCVLSPSMSTAALSLRWWAAPLLFVSHCLVRLVESTARQRYRQNDTVTLFGMCSGCGFYIAATLAAVPWSSFSSNASDLEHGADDCIVVALVIVHLMLQVAQVYHHEILRSLRTLKRIAAPALSTSRDDDRAYVFPTKRGGFVYVQEPHYLCEVLLYAAQWVLLAATHSGCHWPAVLVGVFTLCNLGVTAREHRDYWRTSKFALEMPPHLIIPGVL